MSMEMPYTLGEGQNMYIPTVIFQHSFSLYLKDVLFWTASNRTKKNIFIENKQDN